MAGITGTKATSAAAGEKPEEMETFEVNDKSKIFVVLKAALKGAAHLSNLLPTGSYSVLLILAPLLSDNGHCVHRPLRKLLLTVLLAGCFTLCLASCFTDSFTTLDGSVHYGIITTRGLWTPQLSKQIAMCPKYRLKAKDVAHSVLVLLVLCSGTLLNRDVVSCLFHHRINSVTALGVPPLVGFIASVIFIFMPSERHGIGFPVVAAEAVQAASDITASVHKFAESDDDAEKADKVPLARESPIAVGRSK